METLAADQARTFELTLFLGLLYHVEDPMRCLREVAAVTGELCVLETQVVDEVEGVTRVGLARVDAALSGHPCVDRRDGRVRCRKSRNGREPDGDLPVAEGAAVIC